MKRSTTSIHNLCAEGRGLLLGAAFTSVALVGVARAQEPAAPPASDDTGLEAAWQQVLGTRPDHVERSVDAAASEHTPLVPPRPLPSAPRTSGWRHEISIGGRQFSRTEFDSSPGDIERRSYEFGWSATVGAPESAWRLEYGFSNHVYRFSSATGLLPSTSAPVEGLFEHSLDVAKQLVFSPKWSGALAAGIDIGMESMSDLADALTWHATVEARWRGRDDFALSFGFLARGRLENDGYIVPLIGVDWQWNAKTRLLIDGRGLDLSRAIGDDTQLHLRGLYEDDQFRLDDSGPNPNGAFADRSFQLLLGIDLPVGIGERRFATTRLDIFTGLVFARDIEFRQSNAVVGGDDADPSVVFGARLRLGL